MTFKEYLLETIMSSDALKQSMRDYDKRAMGKTDGSKPKAKRLDQMDKRKNRKAGYAEEEESKLPAKYRQDKLPAMLKRQALSSPSPKTRGRPKKLLMKTRQSGL